MAEVIAALSLATDLGMGQPLEKALRTSLLAVNLGAELGYGPDALSDSYYLGLLWHVGCTADAYEFALWMGGDDIAFRSVSAALPSASDGEGLRHLFAYVGKGRSFPERLGLLAGMLVTGQRRFQSIVASHCDAGVTFCRRLGLRDEVAIGLGQVFERWDGHGDPLGLSQEQLSPVFRLVQVAHDVEVLARLADTDTAVSVVTKRRGGAYDPRVCDGFLARGANLLAQLPAGSAWQAALEAEPMPQRSIPASKLEDLAVAFADFADLKSPFTLGHSTGVSALADAAAEALGLSEAERIGVRRAALVHDIGRAAVPNGIWDKPGPLAPSEFERVRLHAYYSERVLLQSPVLAPLAMAAGAHHERLDGSGYHRGTNAAQLPITARIIASADVRQALSQQRPHRPSFSADEARRQLLAEVDSGKLDRDAVQAMLEPDGLPGRVRQTRPHGLTDREVVVLQLLCRGLTNKEMARTLYIAEKTVGHHIEHIYDKIGHSSRAGAALFAMEHGMVDLPEPIGQHRST